MSSAPRSGRRAGLRFVGFRLVAIAVSLGIALAVAEIAIRLVRPQVSAFTGAGIYAPHPELGHVLRPNLDPSSNPARIGTNSVGFRDRDYPIANERGALRIVGIGDSFTFGAGPVEDNYLDLLEDDLADDGIGPVEVLNAGVAAYNTRQAAVHFREFGLRFEPDLVTLGFFVGNDIEENESDPMFRVVDGELTDPERRPGRVERLLSRSHLVRLLRAAFAGVVRAEESTPPPRAGLDGFLAIERQRMEICRVPPRPRIERGYTATEERLLALARDLERRGIAFLVVLIPDEFQVDETIRKAALDASPPRSNPTVTGDPEDVFDWEVPQRRLAAFFEDHGIAHLDLLPALRDARKTGSVYLPRNTHLDRRGNAIVAEAMRAWILENLAELRGRD